MSIRIELADSLGDGQFVEIRDPRKLSWGQQKRITEALASETTEGQLETAEQIAISLVSNGYVLDADNRPITFPLTKEDVDNVPSVVVEEVLKKFAEVRSDVAPKN